MPELFSRYADLSDLERIVELENACFNKKCAATKEAFQQRLANFDKCFLVGECDGKIVGMVNGMPTKEAHLCDEMYSGVDMYDKSGDYFMIFGVATDPEYQHRGIAGGLLDEMLDCCKKRGITEVVLTCKEELIGFYETHGFVNKGISESEHGDEVWFEMNKILSGK